MFEVIVTTLVIVLGLLAVLGTTARLVSEERGLIRGSAAMHVLFALALRYTQGNIYGEGDLYHFREGSEPLLNLMYQDVVRWLPEVVGVMLRLPNSLGIDDGNSTMSMIALTGLLRYFLLDSFWAIYVFMAFLSFFGKWALYATVRDELKLPSRRPLVVGTMLLPSMVFWSSGLVKEAAAMTGLGALAYGLRAPIKGSRLALALAGAVAVGVIKPYLLFPFSIGAAAWLGLRSSKRSFQAKPIYLLLGIAAGYGLVMVLGALFPAFAPDAFAERAAEAQLYGERAGGGSYYQMGDAKAKTLAGQLVYAPLALLTTLARPALFEVHNITSLIASLEMTALTLYVLRSIARGGATGVRAALGRPVIVLCVLNTVFAGTAIGLATTNFGTLSRYRIPVLPFYATIAVALAAEGSRSTLSRMRSTTASGARAELGARARLGLRGSRRRSEVPVE